jgi:hypothetical protein
MNYNKLPKHFQLISDGLIYSETTVTSDIDITIVQMIKEYIPQCFLKLSSIKPHWHLTSYNGKHRLEEYLLKCGIKQYISNGEFITAMIQMNYQFKPEFTMRYINDKMVVDPNLVFNANYLYRDEIVCECGMTYVRDQKNHHLRSKKHEKEMVKLTN